MAMEDPERPIPRVLEKDRSTPMREEGKSWAGYAFLAFIFVAVAFIGYSLYGLHPPSTRNNPPASERPVVNPPTTNPR